MYGRNVLQILQKKDIATNDELSYGTNEHPSAEVYQSAQGRKFNILGLTPLTGAGTILEFDLASNILPMAGTYKTVSAIDTAIASMP